jgi:hypothetical protein
MVDDESVTPLPTQSLAWTPPHFTISRHSLSWYDCNVTCLYPLSILPFRVPGSYTPHWARLPAFSDERMAFGVFLITLREGTHRINGPSIYT